ncbi:NAD(P)-binding protein [Streptomyces pactum]|uniref:NAD(P)-binding protein n=1 Tax=Streptomyces pactum TaxID=68249 RepID=UPI0027DC9E7E|nr:NAD(P)-binding protein [Streptomyces pactum]
MIVGTGFAGLGQAIRLIEAGIDDVLVLEKATDLGGTWRDNTYTYPGCACDIRSPVYSFSREPNPDWSRSFATRPEILACLRRVADRYGLRRRIRFG